MDVRNNNEWVNYKAGLDDWSNIPRIQQQQHSKNISQINHGSNIYSDRSSSDEKTMSMLRSHSTLGHSSTLPSNFGVNKYSVIPYQKKILEKDNETVSTSTNSSMTEDDLNQTEVPLERNITENEENDPNDLNNIRTETTVAIISDVITTGSAHR